MKKFLFSAAIFATFTIFTACTSDEPPQATAQPAPQEQSETTATTSRADLHGEITVWVRGHLDWGLTGGTPDQPYFDYFQQEFPNLLINEVINRDWHELPAAIAAGDAPDVMFWEGEPPNVFSNMVAQGFLEPLDNFINQDSNFASQFLPGMLEMHRFEGNIYGLPIDVMPNAILLNLDIFDIRNVPHPSPDWTIEQMVELSQQLTNKSDPASPTVGIVRNIEEQDYVRMINFFFQAHGVQGYREENGVRISNLSEDANAITAIQQYLAVQGNNFANTFSQDERISLGLDTSVWNIDWPAGVGAMFVGAGPWGIYVDEQGAPLFNQMVMPPPVGSGGRGNYVAIIGKSMFAGSNNKELAWEYMKAMTSRDFRENAFTTVNGERSYPLRFDENTTAFGWGIPAFEIDTNRLQGDFRDWFLGFQAAATFPGITATDPATLLELTRDVDSGARQLVDALREYDDFVNANNLLN
ncbi:MAG: extracellular solute-binding protein [Firmicutes bacterium]|nr:extracellular solute-binding protein [Bacillota bacterium]